MRFQRSSIGSNRRRQSKKSTMPYPLSTCFAFKTMCPKPAARRRRRNRMPRHSTSRLRRSMPPMERRSSSGNRQKTTSSSLSAIRAAMIRGCTPAARRGLMSSSNRPIRRPKRYSMPRFWRCIIRALHEVRAPKYKSHKPNISKRSNRAR